jgi:hypothetical protein
MSGVPRTTVRWAQSHGFITMSMPPTVNEIRIRPDMRTLVIDGNTNIRLFATLADGLSDTIYPSISNDHENLYKIPVSDARLAWDRLTECRHADASVIIQCDWDRWSYEDVDQDFIPVPDYYADEDVEEDDQEYMPLPEEEVEVDEIDLDEADIEISADIVT